MKKRLPLFLIFAFCLTPLAQACWAPPADEVWMTSEDGKVHVLRNNKVKAIEIHGAKKDGPPTWTAKPEGFNALFSKIHVVNHGDTVVHVRGNHMVSKIDDIAIEVIQKDGSGRKVKAGAFIKKIRKPDPGQPMMSIDPGRYWLKKVIQVSDKDITIENWDGETKTLPFVPVS